MEPTERYKHACYFVALERGENLEGPPRSIGEDIVLGDHIKQILAFRKKARQRKKTIKAFDVHGWQFPEWTPK